MTQPEIVKTVITALRNGKWTHENLIEFGNEDMNKKVLCPTCFDNRKVPLGAKTHLYKDQWENLRKYHFGIHGKTIISYYECVKCGYKREVRDTYRDGKQGLPMEMNRDLIVIWAKLSWESIWENRRTLTNFYKGILIGELQAYKEVYNLLKK